MNPETGIVIISGIIAFVVYLYIDSFLFRRAMKAHTAEHRRFKEKLESIESKLDSPSIKNETEA